MSGKDPIDFVADKYRAELGLPETEDSWERIAKAFIALKASCDNGQYSSINQVIQIVRSFHTVVKQSLLSERTRLSSAALDLVDSVASACGADFEALLPQFFPTLMVLTGRTNKVVITRTKACVLHIIDSTQSPTLLPHFLNHLQEKSASMRLISAECALAYMKCCNPPDLEKESRALDIETLIRKTARDANADVRKVGREIFGAYKILLPNRVDQFSAPLTPTIRKYLDIKSSTSQTASKPAISRVKSMSALTAASHSDRKIEPKHTRTASVTTLKTSGQGLPEARPPSATSRTTRPQALTRANVAASRPESSRQAVAPSSATSTGPSRVISSSTVTSRPPPSHTRAVPSAAPQRPLSRPAAPSSSSTTLASSGPRRVPAPNPAHSTGSAAQKKPISRPASQQSNVATGSATATSRPNSQQSRPVNRLTRTAPIKPVGDAQPSRAMLPPKTRADGTAIGTAPSSKTSSIATGSSTAAAEPVRRPRTHTGGSMQPTASQLAKVKALVIQKSASKKVGTLAARPVPRSVQTTVLSKSSKVNVSRAADFVKSTEPAVPVPTTPTFPASVPLPPSPLPAASIPLPQETLEDAGELLEEAVPVSVGISVITVVDEEPRTEPKAGMGQGIANEAEGGLLDVLRPDVLITDSDGESPGLPSTPPTNNLLQAQWNVQNAKTPISALLSSIQQGFEFSPATPLSPPHSYLNAEAEPIALHFSSR